MVRSKSSRLKIFYDNTIDNQNRSADLRECHCVIGDAMIQQGRVGQALDHFKQCFDICRAEVKRNSNDWAWQWRLSITYSRIGRVLHEQTKLSEALAEYKEGKRIMQELTALDPNNTRWRRDLSLAHIRVGTVLQAQGKPAKALAEYEEGKRIMQELTTHDPDNTHCGLTCGLRTTVSAAFWRRRANGRRRWPSTRKVSGSCRS